MISHGRKLKWLLLASLAARAFNLVAAEPPAKARSNALSYLEPRLLTGTVCDQNDSRKVLFHFRREATNDENRVYVTREFSQPNGALAARERVVYSGAELVSFQLEELQTGARGEAVIGSDQKSNRKEIAFDYRQGTSRKTGREPFQKDTLTSDMLAPFIVQHWQSLMNDDTIKLRIIVISRSETVGFKLTKVSEAVWKGTSVVRLRLQPSSILIAQLVDPLWFIIEKAPPHRILQYTGRTTPNVRNNGKWVDLDALTVFDWNLPGVSPSTPKPN